MPNSRKQPAEACRVVVIWIDWYAYHLARFEGLQSVFGADGEVVGLEMVGGVGVHAGLTFREERSIDTAVETLLPQSSWARANKLTLARLIWRKLNQLRPDVVLVPGYYTLPALAAAIWAKIHGKESVLMTESTASDHTRTRWKEAIKASAIRLLFDWAVAGGHAHVRYLKALGFPAHRVVGYYDVVGNDALRTASIELRATQSAAAFALPNNFFLYVGRLAPEKNVVALLKSWVSYRQRGGSWSLVIAGDGPESTSLRELAAESGFADGITFAGHKSARELVPHFSFARCFVLPSLREPWGLVVNEAMAAGLPVIVSNRCGCAEDLVAEAQNGFIFDPANTGELANRLHKVERLSSEHILRMGALSALRIAPYSPENFGREISVVTDSIRRVPGATSLHRSSEPTA